MPVEGVSAQEEGEPQGRAEVSGLPGASPLAGTALEAVARVRGENSELRELWQEGDEFPAWIAELGRISAALH